MSSLISKSKLQQKINKLKYGGRIPKYQNAGILKKIYYWNAPDYSETKDNKSQSFNQAYALARQNNDKNFWWTDDKGNRNIYNTEFNLVFPQKKQSKETDFSKIITTRNRPYNADTISYINNKLSSLPAVQRAAILANIIEESGGDPFIVGPGNFYGLLQWSQDRYKRKSDNRQEELDNQIQYILDTLNNTEDRMSWTHGGRGSGYNKAIDAHKIFSDRLSTLDKVTHAYTLGYVRPKGGVQSYQNRLKVAQQIYDRIK